MCACFHSDGGTRSRSFEDFLGYAAGVGKTYQMLTEAHELKRRGVDVVIGYFEPHARKETIALTEGLEAYRGRIDRLSRRPLRRNGHGARFFVGGRKSPSSTSSHTPTCQARLG